MITLKDRPTIDWVRLGLILVPVAFFALGTIRLNWPLMFDERYYLGAAINLVDGGTVVNREHPMLAKEILAAGWWLFGDNIAQIRLLPLLAGTLGLYLSALALRRHTGSPETALIFAILLASGFLLFGLSRLTLLEPFAFMFAALSLYLFVHDRPGASAFAIGLAIGCKWTCVPLAALLFTVHLLRCDWRAACWTAILVPAAYLTTFIPGFMLDIRPAEIVHLHFAMLGRISLFLRGHPYASQWWEWVIGGGAAYLGIAGERVIVLATNPLTALLATLAVISFRDRFLSTAFLLSLVLFVLKPVALIHQFILPHAFAIAALAVWLAPRPRLALALCTISVSAFTLAFPALTGGADPIAPWPRKEMDLSLSPVSQRKLDHAVACLHAPKECYP